MPSTLTSLFAFAALFAQSAGSSTVIFGDLRDVRACHDAAQDRDASDAAVTHCDSALRLDGLSETNRRASFANRGVLHYLRGDYAAARDDFTDAIALGGPDRASIFSNRGLAYEQIARGDPAIDALAAADYQAALSEDPDQTLARARLEQLALPFAQRRKLARVSLAALPQAGPHGALFSKVTI